MVRENHHGMGGRGCTKITLGRRSMVYENSCWAGGRWCTKTTIKQVRDGVQKPPLGRQAMVYKNYHLEGAQRCMKTTIKHVRDGAHSPHTNACGSRSRGSASSNPYSDNYRLFNVSSARAPRSIIRTGHGCGDGCAGRGRERHARACQHLAGSTLLFGTAGRSRVIRGTGTTGSHRR